MYNKLFANFSFSILNITKGNAFNLNTRVFVNTNYFSVRLCGKFSNKCTFPKI